MEESTQMEISGPSIEKIKASMRSTWMAGDFGMIAKMLEAGADAFAAQVSLPAGARVLDVACGSGNVAIPLARRGYKVTGVDIAPNLLEQARERAATEKLDVPFDEGDAEQLPYADGSFDGAVTMFGAMFAPRPEIVAAELARVLKPGGLLAMANWNPASFSGAMFKVNAKHVSPTPGIAPPVLWGDKETVRARLSKDFDEICLEITLIDFDLPTNPAGAVTFFRTYFGPTQVAFSRLDDAGQAALAGDLEALWTSVNVAEDSESHTLIRNEYLQVLAKRK